MFLGGTTLSLQSIILMQQGGATRSSLSLPFSYMRIGLFFKREMSMSAPLYVGLRGSNVSMVPTRIHQFEGIQDKTSVASRVNCVRRNRVSSFLCDMNNFKTKRNHGCMFGKWHRSTFPLVSRRHDDASVETQLTANAQSRRFSDGSGRIAEGGENLKRSEYEEEEDVPFVEYDHATNAAYWATRPVSVAKRLVEVGSALGSWFMAGKLQGIRGGDIRKNKNERAENLRNILTNLGPAYIKIGQAVSTRPDIMPPEYLKEFEKLQDRLPPFPTDEAFRIMERELGRPPLELFSYISPEPVAAASLGQVYRAVLRSDNSQVAIKVQRPGVALSIALDVLVLRKLAATLRKVRKFNTDLPSLIDEWASSLFKELDYRHEASNGVRFKDLYQNLDGVYIPTMLCDLTTQKVLVMEWVEGERIRSAYASFESTGFASSGVSDAFDAASNRTGTRFSNGGSEDDLRLVEVGVRCSLEQLLEHGFYHADPHPGNLLRTTDGKLCYLDFGMMGEVDINIRRGLIRATLHLVNREYASLADDFVTLGMLPETADREAVIPALTGVFAEALAGGVNNISFGDLSANLGRTMYQFSFRIPSYYTLLVRSLSVLEGIALASDPSYKVLGAAYPWVARRLLTDESQELRSTLMALVYRDGKFNFRRMESLLTQASRPAGRSSRSSRRGPNGSSSSFEDTAPKGDALALLLSPRGVFVRGIVIEELAKGADAAWRLATDAFVDGARVELSTVFREVSTSFGRDLPPVSTPESELLQTVLTILDTIPKLADKEDAEQVEGLRRLAIALTNASQAQQGRRSDSGPLRGMSSEEEENNKGASNRDARDKAGLFGASDLLTNLFENVEIAADLLQWAIAEMETLGPAERAEALRLPLEIGQAVSSRVVARVIRAILVGDILVSKPSSSGASDSNNGSSKYGDVRTS